MPTIGTNKFLGYSSKPDKILDNPGLGSIAENVIINKGDLCNHPYVIDDFNWGEAKERILAIEDYGISNWGRTFWSITKEGKLSFTDDTGNIVTFELGSFFHPFLNTEIPKINQIFKFYDTLYILGDFFRRDARDPNSGIPRSPRVYIDQIDPTGRDDAKRVMALQGIGQPLKITSDTSPTASSSGKFAAGNWSFACTFAYLTGPILPTLNVSTKDLEYQHSLESNAVIWNEGDLTLSGSQVPTLRIFLPSWGSDTYNRMEPFDSQYSERQPIIGLYAKKDTEEFYKFAGFFALATSPVNDASGDYYITIDVTDKVSNDLNENKIPDFSTHTLRFPCSQMTSFKSRVYSNEYSNGILNSTLQVSPLFQNEYFKYIRTNFFDIQRAQYLAQGLPNYVDENISVPIGTGGSLTGLIEFLGQLVLFKDDSTWVLTDDITIGEVRKLFDTGCVNVKGGDAYGILNNVLYSVSWDGIYAYTGEGNPIKISGLIREDLQKINKERYSFCRLSIDTIYDLVYISFPKINSSDEVISDFIFHPEESGAWTRSGIGTTDLVMFENDRYLNSGQFTKKLGLLEDQGENNIEATWFSGILTLSNDTRKKHWQDLFLQLKEKNLRIRFLTFDGRNQRILTGLTTTSHKFHIGVTTDLLIWRIILDTNKPFRINGYQLDVHLRGRR